MSDASLRLPNFDAGRWRCGRFGCDDAIPGVVLSELNDFSAAAIIARNGKAADVAAKLSAMIGTTVPDAQQRAANAALSLTGIGPGQWLAVGYEGGDVADRLARDLAGLASISDQGSGRFILHVSGPKARAALSKGVPIDIDARIFKPGEAAQTVAGHIGIGLALLDATPRFELVSAVSTRGSLLAWLAASAAEYGLEIR